MLIEVKVSGLTIDPLTNTPIVILKDIEEKKAIPIWIGLFEASAILFENGETSLFTGSQVKELENKFFSIDADEIKGTIAFRGKVRGKCRLVNDPFKEHAFNAGDILITGMTRPEFTKFMEKASAIVTDAGGVLCHAAITAREMKIPCIVGTEKATKIFKEGDFLEVDAEKGIIKKINSDS